MFTMNIILNNVINNFNNDVLAKFVYHTLQIFTLGNSSLLRGLAGHTLYYNLLLNRVINTVNV